MNDERHQSRLEDLHRRAERGGGDERMQRQRDGARLTARERIETLFDPGAFEEIDKFVTHRCRDFGMADQVIPGDGVVAGHGRVNGRLVYAFAQDFKGPSACGAPDWRRLAGSRKRDRSWQWCAANSQICPSTGSGQTCLIRPMS